MRALIIGFDSFDPKLFESYSAAGELPNLSRMAEGDGYSRFKVCTPPQTEVSWTSIATGADPGSHGIFDFVHRNPETYGTYVSILPTRTSAIGTQFVPPYSARTMFDEAVDQGYPATALWWPAMFPVRPESPVRVIPGLGSPDIKGQLGLGSFYSTEKGLLKEGHKTPVEILSNTGNMYTSSLKGPFVKRKGEVVPAEVQFHLELLDKDNARLSMADSSIDLKPGEWSPIFEVKFKTGMLLNVHSVTRAILTSTNPVRLYFLPLQIHPLHSPWKYASPKSFVRQAWQAAGSFLSLGWPQDTTALEDGCISDEQFITLCEDIFAAREKILFRMLDDFKEGVLGSIFDDLDRVQHMFRRDRPEFVHQWYQRLDDFVGRVTTYLEKQNGNKVNFMVMSDHGFSEFQYKVHINRWLLGNGYLTVKKGNKETNLGAIDWDKTKAYAIGLNSLYINLQGREGKGIVPVNQVQTLAKEIKDKLMKWKGPDKQPIFSNVSLRHEVFSGPLLSYGPDMMLGCSAGYRSSSETGLGKWKETSIEENKDHWGADHCIDPELVPGVLFSSQGLKEFPNPSFRDIPPMVVGKYLDHSSVNPPKISGGEGSEAIEERLKGLGYL
ncbi:MAG: alkaline phosphatase family protein [Anaerolineae bacterium]|nr:alkaline phosphatase family protein [Anaerolineae bacterium]